MTLLGVLLFGKLSKHQNYCGFPFFNSCLLNKKLSADDPNSCCQLSSIPHPQRGFTPPFARFSLSFLFRTQLQCCVLRSQRAGKVRDEFGKHENKYQCQKWLGGMEILGAPRQLFCSSLFTVQILRRVWRTFYLFIYLLFTTKYLLNKKKKKNCLFEPLVTNARRNMLSLGNCGNFQKLETTPLQSLLFKFVVLTVGSEPL